VAPLLAVGHDLGAYVQDASAQLPETFERSPRKIQDAAVAAERATIVDANIDGTGTVAP